VKETGVAGSKKEPRMRKPRRIDWGWILFVIVYLAIGIGVMWFIAQLTDGTI
jgi:hypothetical protein